LCAPVPALAQSAVITTSTAIGMRGTGEPLDWIWPTFRTSEFVATGAAMATTAVAYILSPRAHHQYGGVLFDEEVRERIALTSYHLQRDARDASDAMLSTLTMYPFLVDALIIAWGHRGSDQVALQMALIDVEAIAMTFAIQGLTTDLVSRERPYGRNCGTSLPNTVRDCFSDDRYRSFFSGHTSVTFTVAGLVCSHHAHLALYGGGAPDVIACAASVVGAAAVGTLRIMGNVHYPTDVLVGALVGTVSGLGVPWLLHYRGESDDDSGGFTMRLVPTTSGAALAGSF
jgi:membrane-associated phospholipid phosphatase